MTTTNYGYFFHPSADMVGHPQLDFNLFAKPTGEHFDPHSATLTIINAQDHIATLSLSHPWHGITDYRVCAGRINLYDHVEKIVAAYTLGGQLTLKAEDTYTHCSLTSPAPIIGLPEPGVTSTLLANQIESLLAKRQAALGEEEFERRLVAAAPLTLFMACLETLDEKLCHLFAETHSQFYQDLCLLVEKTTRALQEQGLWQNHQSDANIL